jgi:3-deoxy-D-manno-octulosonic-acid transferase
LSENGNDEATAIQRVVLLDAMGELKYWWGVADIAFVGGSFGNRGGQNMLEPAALGAAVCFGPNTRNFANEVELMLSADAAHQLTESNELTKFIDMCCRDPESRNQLGQNAVRLLSSHRNDGSTATQKTLRLLESLLPASNANSIRPEKAA